MVNEFLLVKFHAMGSKLHIYLMSISDYLSQISGSGSLWEGVVTFTYKSACIGHAVCIFAGQLTQISESVMSVYVVWVCEHLGFWGEQCKCAWR